MAAFSRFIERFRRVTYSGRYMPEVDGLRFVAIFLVVCFAHLGTYVADAVLESKDQTGYLNTFLQEGAYGVSIFFIISGFILSLPFAENKLLDAKPVVLRQYLWRRITRLEPTYIITLLLYFIVRVYILHYESFRELLPHFFASLFYVHNIVYNNHSAVNGVAWSLEVEIQFYLLMPLLSYLFLIRNTVTRRSILMALIIGSTVFSYLQQYHIANFLNKGCYFFCGMLLADLYLLNKKDYSNPVYAFLGMFFLVVSFFIPGYYISVYYCVAKIICMLLFFFLVISNYTLKKWFSFTPVAIIGGMCYTIYLLHAGILGLMRHRFAKITFVENTWVNISLHCLAALLAILVTSGIFFLLVEKPTMKRDWYKNIFKWQRS